jgi:hypothetical protein
MPATQEELESRVFPALQELVEAIDRAAELCEKVISDGEDLVAIYPKIAWCLEVLADDYDYNVPDKVVESQLEENGDNSDDLDDFDERHVLTPEARMTLRTTVSNPTHFSAVVVARFVDDNKLMTIIPSKQKTNDIYCQFSAYVRAEAKQYPCLRALWKGVEDSKKEAEYIRTTVGSSRVWQRVIVHRVNGPARGKKTTYKSPPIGKKIIINATNKELFPSELFHHMSSESSHVIEPKGNGIEFHVLALKHLAPTDKHIQKMIRRQTDNAYLTKPWFVGAVVFNLCQVRQLQEWSDEAETKLLATSKGRTKVRRSHK